MVTAGAMATESTGAQGHPCEITKYHQLVLPKIHAGPFCAVFGRV